MRQASALWQQAGSLIAGLLDPVGCRVFKGQSHTRPPVSTPTDWTASGSGSCDRRRLREAAPSADGGRRFQMRNSPNSSRRTRRTMTSAGRLSRDRGPRRHDHRRAGLYPQLNVQAAIRIFPSRRTPWQGWVCHGQQPGPQVFAKPGSSFDLWNGAADLRWGIGLLGSKSVEDGSGVRRCQAIEQDAPCPLPSR